MRNCVFFKILAFFLCAVSLLGAVGGAAGVLALVENNLYNETVDQVMETTAKNRAAAFATQAAYSYADRVLGGCPQELSRSGFNNLAQNYTVYGYSILDAEGNVLESFHPELKASTTAYSTTVTGQYMHLVSLQTESQAREEAALKRKDSYGDVMSDSDGVVVPPEGISIHHVIFTDQDGNVLYEAVCNGATGDSAYYYRNYLLDNGTVDNFAHGYPNHQSSRTGFLFYNPSRQLTYTSILKEDEKLLETTVYGVTFHNTDRSFTFQAENPEGIGILSNESGYLVFTTFPDVPEETVEETVPVTVPETIPEETASETQPTETEVPETEAVEYAEDTTPPEETYEEYHEEEYHEEEYSEGASEEYYEEEYSEEYYEDSSASDVPEEYSEEQWSEDSGEEWYDESAEEQWTEETAEVPQETYADQSVEPEHQENSYAEISAMAQNRIYAEWLLSNGLIDASQLPADMVSDEALQLWLRENGLIRPEQTFPVVSQDENQETDPTGTAPLLINGKPLESYQVNHTDYHNSQTGEYTTAKFVYVPMPELTVEVYVSPDAARNMALYDVLTTLRYYRNVLLPVIGGCLLLFVLSALYLFSAAARSPKTEEIRAGGMNRMPLDLYLILGLTLGGAIAALAVASTPVLLNSDLTLGCSLAAAAAFLCCLIFVGFCFALIAQIKTGGGFWWRHTLTVRFLSLVMKYAKAFGIWLREKALPSAGLFTKKARDFLMKNLGWLREHTQKFLFRIGKAMDQFFSLIPLTWQWLVCGLALACLLLIACKVRSLLLTLICLAASLGIILYGTHCFGVLLESTRRMVKGDLKNKVEDRLMIGCFWDFAKELNSLADVASVAAQKQLKSERMKTELITNVSHDIKTPLTSIINYVDLLQKPHSAEDETLYLDVLSRQSQRLKKLVDDLMDMSKASTGNLDVEITTVDLVESVTQALGEFADKLEYAQLLPVFRHADASVPVVADGELVWRVLGNLLSNIVKYAMPKTRIYLDLTRMNGKVILSLKNISKDPLNIDAEELMERFVRGDISRNTDGSGLGLNIAKSLMELQDGQLQMIVDGDLFKVTLIFPDGR